MASNKRVMGRDETDGPAVAVYAAVVYDVIAATNSSPQTTEINARRRASTLMKWVHIGIAQGVFFILLAVAYEPPGKKWRPIVGGGFATVLMYVQYVYARNCGLRSIEPGTEDHEPERQRGRTR